MQIPLPENQAGGRLWLASQCWNSPLSAPASFPTSSRYIITTLPVVPWRPDLKGQRPLILTFNLPLGCHQQRRGKIVHGPGPSLLSREEAPGSWRDSPKRKRGNQYPDSLFSLPLGAWSPGCPWDLPPWVPGRVERGGSGSKGGQTEVMLHNLWFPASPFWSQGYSLCWASSELQKHVCYPSTSSSTAFWYKENTLNRSVNGCCHDFWWSDSVGLLSCSLRSGNNLDEQPMVIP